MLNTLSVLHHHRDDAKLEAALSGPKKNSGHCCVESGAMHVFSATVSMHLEKSNATSLRHGLRGTQHKICTAHAERHKLKIGSAGCGLLMFSVSAALCCAPLRDCRVFVCCWGLVRKDRHVRHSSAPSSLSSSSSLPRTCIFQPLPQ